MHDLIMLHGSIFLQAMVDSPSGQLNGGTELWEDFDFGDFTVTSDGANYIL